MTGKLVLPTTAERQELADNCTITLNGLPAYITGINADYATIRPRSNPSIGIQWSWPTVQHIINDCDGAFKDPTLTIEVRQ